MSFLSILYVVPKNFISRVIGKLAGVQLPGMLMRPLVGLYSKLAGVDTNEIPTDCKFRSMAEFFTRDLKSGIRPAPMADTRIFVSPCDGTLRSFGSISAGIIEDVKGRGYGVAELLRDEYAALRFANGTYFNCYLSPKDYHHVHAPMSGRVIGSCYIPGTLWPVNDWAFERIGGLNCRNERIVTYLESPFGVVAVVMVGAFNVGKMSVSYDTWTTNAMKPPFLSATHRCASSIMLKAAERLGTFHLGSTVVVLVDQALSESLRIETGLSPGPVKYGQTLARS